jgi:hypothetical protein
MGRKLRVDFSNETVSDEDNRDGAVCLFSPSSISPSYHG